MNGGRRQAIARMARDPSWVAAVIRRSLAASSAEFACATIVADRSVARTPRRASARRAPCPVLLAVDARQHFGRQTVGRAVEDDSPARRPTMRSTNICASATSWMLMIAASSRSAQISQISRMIWREVFGSRLAVGSSTSRSVGILYQRAGDADALALPAGERVGALVAMVDEADAVEQAEGLARHRPAESGAETSARTAHSRAGPESTFSITVSRSTSANSWKIMPMRRRALAQIAAAERR